MQVQHGPRRQPAFGQEQRAVQALEVKRGELGEPDLAPDERLVALVRGGPNPATGVGEPLLQVLTEREVLGFPQDRRLDHPTATLALVAGTEQVAKPAL